MAEQITKRTREAIGSLPDEFKVDVIYEGNAAKGVESSVSIDRQATLGGENDVYESSVRVNQDDFTHIPEIGNRMEVQDKSSPEGPLTMKTRRIINVAPDQVGATWRVDFGSEYVE